MGVWLVGFVYIASHQQRGRLDTVPPFTVPCGRREAQYVHQSQRELNPGASRGRPVHNCCAAPAPLLYGSYMENRFLTYNIRRYNLIL